MGHPWDTCQTLENAHWLKTPRVELRNKMTVFCSEFEILNGDSEVSIPYNSFSFGSNYYIVGSAMTRQGQRCAGVRAGSIQFGVVDCDIGIEDDRRAMLHGRRRAIEGIRHAFVEHDNELRLGFRPPARRSFPFHGGVVQDQI